MALALRTYDLVKRLIKILRIVGRFDLARHVEESLVAFGVGQFRFALVLCCHAHNIALGVLVVKGGSNLSRPFNTTDASILLALAGRPGSGEEDMVQEDADRLAWLARWRLRAILFGLLIAGGLLIYEAHQVWPWLEPLVKEFGSALIVAAVISGTVDLFFKEEFARNAFVAAFRYVLPLEFRDEVEKIIRHEFIAEKQIWSIKIEEIDENIVRVSAAT